MTILECTSVLNEYYKKNDVFELNADFKELFLVSESREKDEAVLLAALESMVDLNVIRKVQSEDKTYWILIKNLMSVEQNVILPGDICYKISETINQFCDNIQDTYDKCSPYAICAYDINNLLIMLEYWRGKALKDATTDPF